MPVVRFPQFETKATSKTAAKTGKTSRIPGLSELNADQIVQLLDTFENEELAREVNAAVIQLKGGEVVGLIRKAARLKGRYLAQMLDMDEKTTLPLIDDIDRARTTREAFEELDQAVSLIKTHISKGHLSLTTEAEKAPPVAAE
ncbi:MAG: hypothetical protein ACPGO3_04200 [Magnetospiraceae bacterium]